MANPRQTEEEQPSVAPKLSVLITLWNSSVASSSSTSTSLSSLNNTSSSSPVSSTSPVTTLPPVRSNMNTVPIVPNNYTNIPHAASNNCNNVNASSSAAAAAVISTEPVVTTTSSTTTINRRPLLPPRSTAGTVNVQRRTWDREEYERRAKERLQREQEQLANYDGLANEDETFYPPVPSPLSGSGDTKTTTIQPQSSSSSTGMTTMTTTTTTARTDNLVPEYYRTADPMMRGPERSERAFLVAREQSLQLDSQVNKRKVRIIFRKAGRRKRKLSSVLLFAYPIR